MEDYTSIPILQPVKIKWASTHHVVMSEKLNYF